MALMIVMKYDTRKFLRNIPVAIFKMKIKKTHFGYFLVFLCLAIFLHFFVVRAQETGSANSKVEYGNEIIVDSDLDGLTDKGEQQIFKTDPGNPDTDGDGYLDGAEILSGSDPLDVNDPSGIVAQNVGSALERETPWIWYLVRAAGILGFIFLWLTVFLGLSIRNPILKKIILPIYSFDLHCFIAAISVFWALIHGTSLLLDAKIQFGIKDIAIPFFSKNASVNVNFLALGILAFYMMVIMTITSYLRNLLNHKFWRVLHFLNPLAFIFVVVHGFFNGTDMKNFYVGSAYLFSSLLLILIYISSLAFAIITRYRKPEEIEITNQLNEYSDQNQG